MGKGDWYLLLQQRAAELETQGMSPEGAIDAAMLEVHEKGEVINRQQEALLLNFHSSKPSFDGWTSLPKVEGALTAAWAVDVEDLLEGKAIIPPCAMGKLDGEDLAHRSKALAQMISDISFADLLSSVREGGYASNYMQASSSGDGEAFIPSRDGRKIMFCRFRCRKVPLPPKGVGKGLWRRYRKKHRQGKGQQEYFALSMLRIVRLGHGIIPLGVESAAQLIDPLANPLSAALEQELLDAKRELGLGLDSVELAEKWARRLLYQSYVAYKALTESDTPMWVTPTEDLALLLANTDAKGVFGRDVQFPSASINVIVPPGLFTSEFIGGTTVSCISICASAAPYGRMVDTLSYLSETGAIETDLSPMPQIMTYGLGDDEEISLSRLKESMSAKLSSDASDGGSFGVLGRSVDLSEFTAMLFNFCANLLLYITSQSDVTKQRKSLGTIKDKGKGKKRKRPLSEVEEWVVGTEVKLDTSSRESFRKGASSTISYSFIVRGHWRNQAHGPNRELRKRIWIKPFVKGKDLSRRIMGHTYKDSEE